MSKPNAKQEAALKAICDDFNKRLDADLRYQDAMWHFFPEQRAGRGCDAQVTVMTPNSVMWASIDVYGQGSHGLWDIEEACTCGLEYWADECPCGGQGQDE